jgi:hypothetical protein
MTAWSEHTARTSCRMENVKPFAWFWPQGGITMLDEL